MTKIIDKRASSQATTKGDNMIVNHLTRPDKCVPLDEIHTVTLVSLVTDFSKNPPETREIERVVISNKKPN